MENFIRKIYREKGIKIPNQEEVNWKEFRLYNLDKLKEM
jgi:hypothetical protein